MLRAASYRAAGIDAPFSIPAAHLRAGTHAGLLATVRALPKAERCFASAQSFVQGVTGLAPPLSPAKPLRETEKRWQAEGVNARSTLWAGARGGAAMTCACLSLLAAAGRPVWPFAEAADGMLVEAFPAAQAKRWGLPHQKYSGAEGESARAVIVDALKHRMRLGEHEPECAPARTRPTPCCAFSVPSPQSRGASPIRPGRPPPLRAGSRCTHSRH